jgi:hypothetical protein
MPFLSGARMLLLEPSKSVILFAPVTVLLPFALVRLWHRDRQAAVLISSTAAITFVVAALWHNPNGGWCWGPRLLIPAIPSSLAAIGPWMDTPFRRMLAVGLFAVGFAISAPAVAISTQIQQLDVPPPAGGVWPPDMGLPGSAVRLNSSHPQPPTPSSICSNAQQTVAITFATSSSGKWHWRESLDRADCCLRSPLHSVYSPLRCGGDAVPPRLSCATVLLVGRRSDVTSCQ